MAVAFLVLVISIAVLSIPYALTAQAWLDFREDRFFRRLKKSGNTLAWPEIENHLRRGEGTLIVEHVNKLGCRTWWTADDLTTAGPKPLLEMADFGGSYVTGKTNDPFVAWCSTYLDKEKAFLTRPTFKFPPGPIETSFLKGLYSDARVVPPLPSG